MEEGVVPKDYSVSRVSCNGYYLSVEDYASSCGAGLYFRESGERWGLVPEVYFVLRASCNGYYFPMESYASSCGAIIYFSTS